MDAEELYGVLSIEIYSEPLSDRRTSGGIRDLSDPLHVVMLLCDFETECMMNGMVLFLENSTGLYAWDTVRSLELVGCAPVAATLSEILSVAERGGITHATLRAEQAPLELHEISSLAQRYDARWHSIFDEIARLGDAIDWALMHEALFRFVDRHFDALLAHVPPSARRA